MTAAPGHDVHYTLEEYVALEESSDVKHEFLAGQIYAMTGGTGEHARLIAAVALAIGTGLRKGAGCRVFSSDLRIRIESANLTTYPDGAVICGQPELAPGPDPYAYSNPRVVVEVLSRSSLKYDRGEKLGYYQSLPSAQEILIVWQDRPFLELYRRTSLDWMCIEAGPGGSVELASLPPGVVLDVDSLYLERL